MMKRFSTSLDLVIRWGNCLMELGGTFKQMFPNSVEYNKENAQKALSNVEQFDASLGSTNLYKPLNYVFSQTLHSDLSRHIFVITGNLPLSHMDLITLM